MKVLILDINMMEEFTNGNKYENCLIRLPIWADMSLSQVEFVITKVLDFFNIDNRKLIEVIGYKDCIW